MYTTNTPILDALIVHMQRERVSAHVPGHKAGQGLPAILAPWLGAIGRLDVTELPGLDDLYAPSGPIKKARQLAAALYGADETHLLVGGSTTGNLAVVLGTLRPGDVVLIGRNAHQSVWNALQLVGVQFVAIMPEIDALGVMGALCPERVAVAFEQYPEAALVWVTSPTYHGAVSDLRRITDIAHRNGAFVAVDEAHGAHLGFAEGFPPSALQMGADVVVQSAHKMLPALTPTGYLHVQGTRVNRSRIAQSLRMVQTSSPSYVLLASLDAARAELEAEGTAQLTRVREILQHAAVALSSAIPGVLREAPAGTWQDPCKWTLRASALGRSGFSLEETLRSKYGVFVELFDETTVLLAWSYATTARDVQRVSDALLQVGTLHGTPDARPTPGIAFCGQAISPLMGTIPLWLQGEALTRPVETAIGCIVAESVVVYPPGIPVLLPGERMTAAMAAWLLDTVAQGVRVDGVVEGHVRCVVEREI